MQSSIKRVREGRFINIVESSTKLAYGYELKCKEGALKPWDLDLYIGQEVTKYNCIHWNDGENLSKQSVNHPVSLSGVLPRINSLVCLGKVFWCLSYLHCCHLTQKLGKKTSKQVCWINMGLGSAGNTASQLSQLHWEELCNLWAPRGTCMWKCNLLPAFRVTACGPFSDLAGSLLCQLRKSKWWGSVALSEPWPQTCWLCNEFSWRLFFNRELPCRIVFF